jgi:hypothetical protein
VCKYLVGLSKVCQRAVYILSQHLTYGAVCLRLGFTDPGIQGWWYH